MDLNMEKEENSFFGDYKMFVLDYEKFFEHEIIEITSSCIFIF